MKKPAKMTRTKYGRKVAQGDHESMALDGVSWHNLKDSLAHVIKASAIDNGMVERKAGDGPLSKVKIFGRRRE